MTGILPSCLMDLHLHLDGSLSPAVVKRLAALQNIPLPDSDKALHRLLTVEPDCRDLNQYLEKFDFPLSLLQTEDAIATAVYALAEELREQGLLYAEIRFAPQLHTRKGLSQEAVVEAAIEGMRQSDFRCNLILCCMRGNNNHADNIRTVQVAKAYRGQGVAALDLAGAEALYPTPLFEDLFRMAAREHIPFTIHAGEAAGADSVTSAVAYGAKRIGHGVRCVEDAALMERLAEQGVALELCPTSNLQTRVFDRLEAYPLRRLMEVGVKITVNTDNRTVSGTTIQREWQGLIDTFALTQEEIRIILLNTADAAFADADTKQYLRERIGEA